MKRFKFFFSSRRRHTRSLCDWSSDVCSSDLHVDHALAAARGDAVLGQQRALSVALFGHGEHQRRERILDLLVLEFLEVLRDRKSTRLNSSHTVISYAVFCLKKKNRYSSRRL